MTTRQIETCWAHLARLLAALATGAAIGVLVYMLTGCASLSRKTVAGAGTVSAVKLETSGGTATGTMLPNILVGGAAMAFATVPDSDRRPVYVRATRHSLLSRVFNLGVSDEATVYIGAPGDTADSVRAVIGR